MDNLYCPPQNKCALFIQIHFTYFEIEVVFFDVLLVLIRSRGVLVVMASAN